MSLSANISGTMKGKKQTQISSAYIVNLDFQKPDGYWVCSHNEDIYVCHDLTHSGKGLHREAEKLIALKYKGIKHKINSVTYV